MLWLLRRLLVLWCIAIAFCLSTMGLGRLVHAPDTLQAWGFDMCADEPCFRGIKLGMSWAEARFKLPEATPNGQTQLTIGSFENQILDITLSAEGKIESIASRSASRQFLPLSAGEVIQKYGPPCHVYVRYGDLGHVPASMFLIYPALRFWVGDPQNTTLFHLTPMAPIFQIEITTDTSLGKCFEPGGYQDGAWHGFMAADWYITRFRQESDARQ